MRCARTAPPVRAAPDTSPTHGTDERQLAQIQDVMFPSKKLLSCPENRSLVAQYSILKCMKATGGLRPRRLIEVVPQRLREEPVVILPGPRTVAKSPLLAALAAEFDRRVLDLDRPDARAAAASDPSFIVSGPGPVLIDEFQHVPEILDAIKAELNRDTRPGRFVLTGSTRYTVLPQAAQSLTGRGHVVNVLPLSQGELDGHRERFIDLLWQDPERIPPAAVPACSRDDYVNRILAGGFPMILQRQTSRARTSWFADYVDLVLMRDVLDIARIR